MVPPEEGPENRSSGAVSISMRGAGEGGINETSPGGEGGFCPLFAACGAGVGVPPPFSCERFFERDCLASENQCSHSITKLWASGEGLRPRILAARKRKQTPVARRFCRSSSRGLRGRIGCRNLEKCPSGCNEGMQLAKFREGRIFHDGEC